MQVFRHYCPCFFLLACCGMAGCDPASGFFLAPSKKPLASAPDNAAGSPSGQNAPIVQSVQLNFDILRADFPKDSTRHSLKVWNHVDRNCLDARTVSRLARNGLRVGVAAPDAWPAVQAILTASKARVEPLPWEGQSGLPVVAPLGAITEPESIFSYGDAGRLNGKSFSAGQKLMQLDYAVLAQSGGAVEMRWTFEVRHDRGEMTWESSGGAVRQVPAYDRHVFEDLTAGTIIPTGSTLVIGPDERAEKEYLVGARFFEPQRDGSSYETVYFVTPRPTRAAVKGFSMPRSPPAKDSK